MYNKSVTIEKSGDTSTIIDLSANGLLSVDDTRHAYSLCTGNYCTRDIYAETFISTLLNDISRNYSINVT